MIDLILFAAIVGAYAGGWWCGVKYHTVANMWKELFD